MMDKSTKKILSDEIQAVHLIIQTAKFSKHVIPTHGGKNGSHHFIIIPQKSNTLLTRTVFLARTLRKSFDNRDVVRIQKWW